MTRKSEHKGTSKSTAGYKAALLSKLQEQLEHLRATQERTKRLIDALPDELPFEVLDVGGRPAQGTQGFVKLAVYDRKDLDGLTQLLPAEPMVLVRKDTDPDPASIMHASYVEQARQDEKLSNATEVQSVAPYSWHHFFSTHGSISHSNVHWTTRLRGDMLVRVMVGVHNDPAHVVDQGEGVTGQRFRLQSAPAGELISEGNDILGDFVGFYTVYWPQEQAGSMVSRPSDVLGG